MKKIMKRTLALLLILTMGLSLVACASPNTELYNAMEKMQEVTSMESETEMSFEISGEGFPESDQMVLDQMTAALSGFAIKLEQKLVGNKEQTQAKSESKVGIDFGGISVDLNMWNDVDLELGNMKTIIKIPAMLSGFMGPDSMSKEYLYYDMLEFVEDSQEREEVDMEKMLDLQNEFQPKIIELADEIEKEFTPDFKIIDSKEDKEVNGEKVKVYEMKLDDQMLKELIKEFGNTTLDNEKTKEFILEYIDLVMDMMSVEGISEEEIAEVEKEMNEIKENLDENMEKFKEEFNKFMEKMDKVQILGEEGISIEYSINRDGYIVETVGSMDFEINLSELSNLLEETEGMEGMEADLGLEGVLNLKINYNTKNKNINDPDMEIDFPEMTEENSIDYMEMLEEQMLQLEEQMDIYEDYDMYEDYDQMELEFEGAESAYEYLRGLSEEEMEEYLQSLDLYETEALILELEQLSPEQLEELGLVVEPIEEP